MQLIIKYKDQILSDFQYDMFKNPEKLVESVQRLYWKKYLLYIICLKQGEPMKGVNWSINYRYFTYVRSTIRIYFY